MTSNVDGLYDFVAIGELADTTRHGRNAKNTVAKIVDNRSQMKDPCIEETATNS